MSSVANEVVQRISTIMESDGGSLQLVKLENRTATLRYDAGVNPDCDTCVWAPDDLKQFVLGALQDRAVPVDSVELVEPSTA